MKSNIACIAVITIILIFTSCEEKEPVEYCVPQELKEYGDFREGSYWIYQVDSSNIEDSIWVTSRILSYDDEVIDKKVVSLFEKITISCESNQYITNLIEIKSDVNINYLAFDQIDNNSNIRYGMTFHYNNSFLPYPGSSDSIIIYDTINLIRNKYSNVLYKKVRSPIIDLSDYSKEYDTLEYWIARNIGVIKKVIRTQYGNKTYSLKRYSVIQ